MSERTGEGFMEITIGFEQADSRREDSAGRRHKQCRDSSESTLDWGGMGQLRAIALRSGWVKMVFMKNECHDIRDALKLEWYNRSYGSMFYFPRSPGFNNLKQSVVSPHLPSTRQGIQTDLPLHPTATCHLVTPANPAVPLHPTPQEALKLLWVTWITGGSGGGGR